MFRNDPLPSDLPVIGKGAADIAVRTQAGQAAVYDGTDPQALIDFLGDTSLRMIDGVLFRASSTISGTSYVQVSIPKGATVVYRPTAGDWKFLTDDQLKQEYAIVEVGDAPVPAVKKAAVKKAAAALKS